jgi:hypothetical protein
MSDNQTLNPTRGKTQTQNGHRYQTVTKGVTLTSEPAKSQPSLPNRYFCFQNAQISFSPEKLSNRIPAESPNRPITPSRITTPMR